MVILLLMLSPFQLVSNSTSSLLSQSPNTFIDTSKKVHNLIQIGKEIQTPTRIFPTSNDQNNRMKVVHLTEAISV